MMRAFYTTLCLFLLWPLTIGQVVTTDPALPIDNQPVTITFHADRGNKGLMNYSGTDVYLHTGVITDKSSTSDEWKYIKTTWTTTSSVFKLTKMSANEYQYIITPSIRAYYGVPEGETILKMAFVFRNTNASKTGRDVGHANIYTDVYEEGLNVSFLEPSERFSFETIHQPFPIEVNANGADSIFLYFDNSLVGKWSGSVCDTSLTPNDCKRHELKTLAKKNEYISGDTTWFMAPGNTIEESLPSGIEDGITYNSNDSVTFEIYAPYKSNIYLIGDFNDWLPDSMYQFKKDGDHFWITLGGLTPGREYAFQYLVDENLRIADPYSEKILDPDHDKDIPKTVYPNLLSYPTAKTQQITGVIQPGRESYVWNDNDFSPPEVKDLVIYELLIRDFVTTHDIKDVMGKLDYLQTLGINAIELMPFSEFEGNSSWGYNPSFYFAPDKYYGRDTDFKDFVQACHSRGIAVIMDMVLNHAYGQNPMVRMYFDADSAKPALNNPWFNRNSPNKTYSWGNDFNHESAATQYFVDRVVKYWLEEYRIDGFRFDFTKGFTNTPGNGDFYDASRIAILERVYNQVKSVNHNAYMICEHFAPNSEETVLANYGMLLWGNGNYNYNEATMGYIQKSDLSWYAYPSRGWSNPNLVSYMESHDEERLMFKNEKYGNSSGDYHIQDTVTALQRMELAGAFFFSIPGPKMIWQFGELGYDVSIDYNGRVGEKPVKWDYYNNYGRQHLYRVWAKLIDLRKNYPVFQSNDFTLNVGSMVALKSIVLRNSEEDAVVIGNFGVAQGTIIPGFTKEGWWYEVFSGDSIQRKNSVDDITLDPGEYRIYTSKKMNSAITGIQNNGSSHMMIYPNPALDYVHVSPLTDGNLEIYNVSGNKVREILLVNGPDVDISDLPAGLYIMRIQQKDEVLTSKFVKR